MLFSMPQLDMLRANLLGNADRFAEQSLLGSFILCNNPASIQKRERCDEAAEEAALLPDQWQNSINFIIFFSHAIVSWPSEAFLDHLFPVPAMVVSRPCASIHKLLPTVSIAGTRTEKRFHLRLIPCRKHSDGVVSTPPTNHRGCTGHNRLGKRRLLNRNKKARKTCAKSSFVLAESIRLAPIRRTPTARWLEREKKEFPTKAETSSTFRS